MGMCTNNEFVWCAAAGEGGIRLVCSSSGVKLMRRSCGISLVRSGGEWVDYGKCAVEGD